MFFGCTSDVVRRYFWCLLAWCTESVHDILNGGTSVGTSVGTLGWYSRLKYRGLLLGVVPDVPDEYGHSTDVFRMSG